MNVNDVKEMVKKTVETEAYSQVLRAIRDGKCADPAACAREVLAPAEEAEKRLAKEDGSRIRVETLERAGQLAHYVKVSSGVQDVTARRAEEDAFELFTRIGDTALVLTIRGFVYSRDLEAYAEEVQAAADRAKQPPTPQAVESTQSHPEVGAK